MRNLTADRSTIAAIATPTGIGGIGIVRISGPDALRVAGEIFRPGFLENGIPVRPPEPAQFASWHMQYGQVVDPESGRPVDEVVLAVMRAPASYTREDVVEIQAHAGPAVLKAIMGLLTARGVRLAEPGEFTRRAFLNGRIDLTQAEAVIDIINARSEAAMEMAMAQMAGGLKAAVSEIRLAITDVLAEIEALVDFPEAMEDEIDVAAIHHRLSATVCHPIEDLIARHEAQNLLRSGPRVVIAGGPNVGKSSLMNRLICEDRAIVTDQPGTTRDLIEAALIARGIPLILTDTAGIRSDPDPVERLGIDKARKQIQEADLVLLVIDLGQPVRDEDRALFEEFSGKPVIVVINKTDLPAHQHRFCLPDRWEAVCRMEISALHAIGIDALKQALADFADAAATGQTERVVPNLRHRAVLARGLESVTDAIDALSAEHSPELLSIDLRAAYEALGEITGETVAPDVLNRIFDRYCIGK